MASVQQLIYQVQLGGTQQVNQSVQQIIDRQKELKRIIASIPEAGTPAYQALDAQIRAASNGTQTLADVQRNLTQQYAQGSARVREFNRNLRQGTAAAGSINDLRNRLIAAQRALDNIAVTVNGKVNPAWQAQNEAVRQLSGELSAAEQASGRFQRNVGNYPDLGASIDQTFQQVGATLVQAFSVGALIASVKSGFQEIISLGTDFARVRSTLTALNQGGNVGALIDDAKALGASTEFTATQVGNLQIAYTKLGFNQQEILDATGATLNLATATGSDLARSAEVAGSTLRAYGLETSETIRLTDIMAKSFATTALDLDKFAEAQKQVGPIARNLNFEIEDTTALLGVLANAGISGSAAGVALRNSLLKVADPASALNKQLVELDESFADGVNDSGEYIKALQLLQKQGLDLGEVLGISDKRAVAAFATLINGSQDVERLAESFRNAGGAGAEMAEIIRNDIQGDFDVLNSTAEGLALNLFDQLEPAIRTVVQAFTSFISLLNGVVTVMSGVPALTTFIVTATIAWAAILVVTRVRILGVTIAELAKIAAQRTGALVMNAVKIATLAFNVVQALFTGGTVAATSAVRAFTAAIASNPIGLVAVGISTAVTALVGFGSATGDVNEELEKQETLQDRLGKRREEAIKQIGAEIARSDLLFDRLKDDNTSREEKGRIIDLINEKYDEYLPFLLTEKTSLEDIERVQLAVNRAIEQNLIEKLKQQAIEEELGTVIADQLAATRTLQQETGLQGSELRELARASSEVEQAFNKLNNEFRQLSGEETVNLSDNIENLNPLLLGFSGNVTTVADQLIKESDRYGDTFEFAASRIKSDLEAIDRALSDTVEGQEETNNVFLLTNGKNISSVRELKNEQLILRESLSQNEKITALYQTRVKELTDTFDENSKKALELSSSLSRAASTELNEVLKATNQELNKFGGGPDGATQSYIDRAQSMALAGAQFGQGAAGANRELIDLRVSLLKSDQVLKEIESTYGSLNTVVDANTSGTKKNAGAKKDLTGDIDRLNKAVQKQIDLAAVERAGGSKTIEGLRELQAQRARDLELTFERLDKEAEALRKKGVSEERILRLNEDQKNQLRDQIARETDEKVRKLIEDQAKAEAKAIREAVEETITAIEETENRKLLEVEAAYAEQRKAIQRQAADTEQLQQAQALKLEDLERKQQAETLLIQINGIKQQLKIADLAASDRLDLERDLVGAQREFADLEVEIVRSKEERKAELIQQGIDLQKQALDQLKSTIDQISNIVQEDAQRQIDRLNNLNEARQSSFDNGIARHERNLEIAIEEINASDRTAEEKEREIARVKAARLRDIDNLKKAKEQQEQANEIFQQREQARQQRAVEFQKKVAAIEQAIASTKIAINAAQTLSNNLKAVSEGAAIPFPANIAAIVTIVAAIASGIASITQLTRSTQVQQLETGGYISPSGRVLYASGGNVPGEGRSSITRPPRRSKGNGGLHVGPLHSGGGIPIEVEGGEFELNRWATSMFLPMASWMNEQGLRKKTGKPYSSTIPGFGDSAPSGLSVTALKRAVTVPMPKRVFQTGGLVTGGGGLGELSGVLTELSGTLSDGFQGIERSNQEIANRIQNQRVTLSVLELRDAQAELDLAEAQSEV